MANMEARIESGDSDGDSGMHAVIESGPSDAGSSAGLFGDVQVEMSGSGGKDPGMNLLGGPIEVRLD